MNVFGFILNNGDKIIGEVESYLCGSLNGVEVTCETTLEEFVKSAVYVYVKNPMSLMFTGQGIATIPYCYEMDNGVVIIDSSHCSFFEPKQEVKDTYESQFRVVKQPSKKLVLPH